MTKLLFTNSHGLLFGSIAVRVLAGNRASLEADKQDITQVTSSVQVTLSRKSRCVLQPQTWAIDRPDFPIFQGVKVGPALF